MALFAILTDDKLSIREIRDFPQGTVFKPGYAFPVVIAQKPVFDPTLSDLVQSIGMPVGGVVTVSWVVTDLSQATKDGNAKVKGLRDLYDAGDILYAKVVAKTATPQDERDLGIIAWRIARETKRATINQFQP